MFVFVYGTLKKGFPNSHCLTGTKYIGEALTVDKYPLVIASRYNIPYLLGAKNLGNQVAGEVYDVTDSQLKVLDTLEGYPGYYNRITIPVLTGVDSEVISCYTYVLDRYKDSLLQCVMLNRYSEDESKKYVKPCDRLPDKVSSHHVDVMDYSK